MDKRLDFWKENKVASRNCKSVYLTFNVDTMKNSRNHYLTEVLQELTMLSLAQNENVGSLVQKNWGKNVMLRVLK